MVDNPYSSYRKTQIETATPGQLVVLLYQGAVRFLSIASSAMDQGNIELSHTALLRAQEILLELRATLNPEAGEVASSLSAIYDYMLGRLIEANLRKDPEPVREVLSYLQELLPAWETAARASDAVESRVLLGVS